MKVLGNLTEQISKSIRNVAILRNVWIRQAGATPHYVAEVKFFKFAFPKLVDWPTRLIDLEILPSVMIFFENSNKQKYVFLRHPLQRYDVNNKCISKNYKLLKN